VTPGKDDAQQCRKNRFWVIVPYN